MLKKFELRYTSMDNSQEFVEIAEGPTKMHAFIALLESINQGITEGPIIPRTYEREWGDEMFKNDKEREAYLKDGKNWMVVEENNALGTRIEICRISHITFVRWFYKVRWIRDQKPHWSEMITMYQINGEFKPGSLTFNQMVSLLKEHREEL